MTINQYAPQLCGIKLSGHDVNAVPGTDHDEVEDTIHSNDGNFCVREPDEEHRHPGQEKRSR